MGNVRALKKFKHVIFIKNKCHPHTIEIEHIDDMQDLFQLEIVEGEELYACNVCNEGFEKEGEIKKHIEKYHHQVLLQIMKEMYEDKEYRPNDIIKDNEKYKHDDSLDTVSEDEETDGEDDDAFLAKFDEDGQLID